MKTIGFVGLGAMGKPMAKNLLKAGFGVVFYARRPEVIHEMTAEGARAAKCPAQVAEQAETVITILPADSDVQDVWAGPKGLLECARPGHLFIDMSTISPATIRSLAPHAEAKGAAVLDAPVSGGDAGAAAGTLTIMVGGAEDAVERAMPLFEAMGQKIFHVGSLGMGQTVKICNQLLSGSIMGLISEALVLAKKAGADPKVLADVVAVSSGNSTVFQARVPNFVLKDHYKPGFQLDLMRKDLGLALELGAQQNIPLPIASAAHQLYTAAANRGLGDEDFAAVCKVVERTADAAIV